MKSKNHSPIIKEQTSSTSVFEDLSNEEKESFNRLQSERDEFNAPVSDTEIINNLKNRDSGMGIDVDVDVDVAEAIISKHIHDSAYGEDIDDEDDSCQNNAEED